MDVISLLTRQSAAPAGFLRGVASHAEQRTDQVLAWVHPNTDDATRARLTDTLGQVRAHDWATALAQAPTLVGPAAGIALAAPADSRNEHGALLDAIVTCPHAPLDVAAHAAHQLVVHGPTSLHTVGHLGAFVTRHPELGATLGAAATNRDVGDLLATAAHPDTGPLPALVNDLLRASGMAPVSVALARAGARADHVLAEALASLRPPALLDIARATIAAPSVRATALLTYLTRERVPARALQELTTLVIDLAAADGIDPQLVIVFRRTLGGPWPLELLTGPAITAPVFTAALAQAHRGTRLPPVLATIACHPNAVAAQRTTAAALIAPDSPWVSIAKLGPTKPSPATLGGAVPAAILTEATGPLWRDALDVAASTLVSHLDSPNAAHVLRMLTPQFTGSLSELVIAASAIAS